MFFSSPGRHGNAIIVSGTDLKPKIRLSTQQNFEQKLGEGSKMPGDHGGQLGFMCLWLQHLTLLAHI